MDGNYVSLNNIVHSAKLLSTTDKVKLLKQITSQIEQELRDTSTKSRKSLRGLWRGLEISDNDISRIRREMWQNFPREDIE